MAQRANGAKSIWQKVNDALACRSDKKQVIFWSLSMSKGRKPKSLYLVPEHVKGKKSENFHRVPEHVEGKKSENFHWVPELVERKKTEMTLFGPRACRREEKRKLSPGP